MKHYFPQYRFKLLKDGSGPGKDPANYDPATFLMALQAMRREYGISYDVKDEDVQNVLITANAEHALFNGKGTHFFVDPLTEKVILNATAKLSGEQLAQYRPPVDIGVVYREKDDPIMFNFASDSQHSSLINVETLGIYRINDIGRHRAFVANAGEKEDQDENFERLKKAMKFLLGCFMLADCFPDVFKEGLPDYVKHPNWFRKLPSRSISVDRVKREVCPHIRSGHFRLLSSDRYVHKKGQVIFVKPAMVKGRAKHTDLEDNHAEQG